MRSKTSKRKAPDEALWRAEPACSEPELEGLAREIAGALNPGDRVVLEGPLGAGKSTFARALLRALGVLQSAEGSPTFAIAHEYQSHRGLVVHADLYRLRSEEELEETGVGAYLWERDPIVILEWLSLWPGFERATLRPREKGSVWRIELDFLSEEAAPEQRAERRRVTVTRARAPN